MSKWALILGASTGHGGATAISLAEKWISQRNYGFFIVTSKGTR